MNADYFSRARISRREIARAEHRPISHARAGSNEFRPGFQGYYKKHGGPYEKKTGKKETARLLPVRR